MNRLPSIPTTPSPIHPIETNADLPGYDLNPSRHCLFLTEDHGCKTVLVHLGLLDKLVPEPPNNKVGIYFTTRVFNGMACFEHGHPNPIDNGYFIVLLNRRQCTTEQAMHLFRESFAGSSLGPITEVETSADSSNN